jgi:hypothetical protein
VENINVSISNGVKLNATNLNNAFPSKTALTTKGDLYAHNGTEPTRIAVGANNLVLTADSAAATGVKWASATAAKSVRSVVTTDTATNADDVLILSGASFTQTLFTPVGNSGKIIDLLHNGTSITQVYTITATGLGTYALYTNGERLRIVSDGTNWIALSHFAQTDWASNVATTITATGGGAAKGTTTTDYITWRRDGSEALIDFNYRHTAAGTAGSGLYQIALPGGLVLDTTRHQVYTGTDATASVGFHLQSTVGANLNTSGGMLHRAYPYSTTLVCISGETGGTNYTIWGSSSNSLSSTTLNIKGAFRIPISGWKA